MNLYDLLLRMFGWNDSNSRERQLQSLRIKDKLGGGSDDSLDKVWVPTADDLERASRAKEESLEKRRFYEQSDQRVTKWLKAGAVPIQRTVDEVVHQKRLDEMREQIWPEGTDEEQEVEWNRRLLGKRFVAPREMVPDGFTEEECFCQVDVPFAYVLLGTASMRRGAAFCPLQRVRYKALIVSVDTKLMVTGVRVRRVS